jgi:hypothetical protein
VEIAAFAISILALVAAAASAAYTRAEANNTKLMADTDAERRHEERRPSIEFKRLDRTSEELERFEVLNRGPLGGDEVVVSLIAGDKWEACPLSGICVEGTFVPSVFTGPLPMGHRQVLLGVRDPSVTHGLARFQLTAIRLDSPGGAWGSLAEVDYPPSRAPIVRTL